MEFSAVVNDQKSFPIRDVGLAVVCVLMVGMEKDLSQLFTARSRYRVLCKFVSRMMSSNYTYY